jgi:hypothetical protein
VRVAALRPITLISDQSGLGGKEAKGAASIGPVGNRESRLFAGCRTTGTLDPPAEHSYGAVPARLVFVFVIYKRASFVREEKPAPALRERESVWREPPSWC